MKNKYIHCRFFLVKYETVIIPPETKIEERQKIIPSISETFDGRVIK